MLWYDVFFSVSLELIISYKTFHMSCTFIEYQKGGLLTRNCVMVRPFDDVSFFSVSLELIKSYKAFHMCCTYIESQKGGSTNAKSCQGMPN